jgi:hypothetical protein
LAAEMAAMTVYSEKVEQPMKWWIGAPSVPVNLGGHSPVKPRGGWGGGCLLSDRTQNRRCDGKREES